MYCYVLFLYLKQLKIIHDELYHREEWISFRSISFQSKMLIRIWTFIDVCSVEYLMLHLIITIISGWIYQSLKLFSYSNTVAIVAFEDANSSRLSSNPTHRIFESPLPNFPQINKNPITYHSKLHDRGLFKNSSRNSTVHRQRSWKIITGTLCHSIRVYTTLEKLLEH